MSIKMDRQGARTPADLDRRYNLGKKTSKISTKDDKLELGDIVAGIVSALGIKTRSVNIDKSGATLTPIFYAVGGADKYKYLLCSFKDKHGFLYRIYLCGRYEYDEDDPFFVYENIEVTRSDND